MNFEPAPKKSDQKSNYWEVGFFMAKYSYFLYSFKEKIELTSIFIRIFKVLNIDN